MNNPSILRIKRDISHWGLKRRWWNKLRRSFFFYDQEGYFNASLHDAFGDVTSLRYQTALRKIDKLKEAYDVVVVNAKSVVQPQKNRWNKIRKLSNIGTISILVETGAEAGRLPDNNICDSFDLIFKRECFKDKSRYDLSNQNKPKLRTTMLPCLQVPLLRNSFAKFLKPIFIPQAPKLNDPDKKHDVFFCGNVASSKTGRIEAVKALKEDPEIDFHGGLQPKNDEVDLPEELRFPRMSSGEYARAFQRSKIVLALDGIGQFTFRHLEAWYFGCFMISSPSIRELDLPLPAEEDKHYIAYDDTDDLKKKVTYYAEHNEEREQIAEAGKKMFMQEYDPEKHGDYIQSQIRKVL